MVSALTAMRLDVLIEVILAVVVGQFFASLDVPDCLNAYFVRVGVMNRLAVGPAGMVYIASQVGSGRTIDSHFLIEFEEVAVRLFVGLFVANPFAGVLDYHIALFPVFECL